MSSSEAIKKELDIFQCCEIKIREFAEDLITDAVRDKSQSSSHMADAKKCYEMLRTTVLKDQKENFWLNIYILCVAEIYLAFCGYDGRQGREILAEIKIGQLIPVVRRFAICGPLFPVSRGSKNWDGEFRLRAAWIY